MTGGLDLMTPSSYVSEGMEGNLELRLQHTLGKCVCVDLSKVFHRVIRGL